MLAVVLSLDVGRSGLIFIKGQTCFPNEQGVYISRSCISTHVRISHFLHSRGAIHLLFAFSCTSKL